MLAVSVGEFSNFVVTRGRSAFIPLCVLSGSTRLRQDIFHRLLHDNTTLNGVPILL
jgi:hypothetical protein